MRNLFSVIFTFFITFNSFGQAKVYFGGGYSGGFYNMKNMNLLIDRYNDSRTWLDKKMKHINYMQGFEFGIGMRGENNFAIDYFIACHAAKSFAEGTQPNGEFGQRYIKFSDNYGSLMISKYFNSPIGVGASWDVGLFKTKTKLTEEEFTRKDLSVNTGLSAYLLISPLLDSYGLSFKLYYHFPVVRNNGTNLGEELDGVNYWLNTFDYRFSSAHFGASASILICSD